MKKNLTLPLLCSSLVFFYPYGITIAILLVLLMEQMTIIPHTEIENYIGMVFGIITALFGIVSLAGTLLVLRELHGRSKFWFRGIPHVIVLIAFCFAGPAFSMSMFFIFHPIFILTALLSLTSIGFFLSYLNPKEGPVQLFIISLSVAVGLFAIVTVFFMISAVMNPFGYHYSTLAGLFGGTYSTYLMPIIGLCFIASAFLVQK